MDYLRSLKKPALEAGAEAGLRELESGTTEEVNSVAEQEVRVNPKREVREIPKRVDKDKAISEQDIPDPTSKTFMCESLNASTLAGSNNDVVHIVTSGSPQHSDGTPRLCRPKRSQEQCAGESSRLGPVLECRNPSCDCRTVTC